MDARREFRQTVLKGLGTGDAFVNRLLQYNDRPFRLPANPETIEFPLEDEPSVALWRHYAQEVERANGIECLSRYLIQFRFPIAAGMSIAEDYLAATGCGAGFEENSSRPCGLRFADSRGVRLWIHQTPAGSIPVWLASNRSDFVTLLRALLFRNEPVPVSDSLGAYIVSGFRNWHRHYSQPPWSGLTDRFLILSSGPYSGVPAHVMNMSIPAWREMSVRIRLEHECTHYFTRRLFGCMANNLYDEILADYSGIVIASGAYRAGWALRFLGIRSDGSAAAGGRLNHYLPADIPGPASRSLRLMVVRAISNLERFDSETPWTRDPDSTPLVIWSLAALSLEELASDGGAQLLAEKLQQLICERNRAQTIRSGGGGERKDHMKRRALCEKRYKFSES